MTLQRNTALRLMWDFLVLFHLLTTTSVTYTWVWLGNGSQRGKGIKCGSAGGIGNHRPADERTFKLIGLNKDAHDKSNAVYMQCGLQSWDLEGETGKSE